MTQLHNDVNYTNTTTTNAKAKFTQTNSQETLGILAQAENSYRTGDSDTTAQADSVLPIAQAVTSAAQDAKTL